MKSVEFKVTASSVGSTLKSIGEKAFYNCKALNFINNPNGMVAGVSTIGNYAFYGCTGLKDNDVSVIGALDFISNSTSIGMSSFEGCSGISSLVRMTEDNSYVGLDSVTTIGESAFKGCTGLSKIELPQTLVSVSASAFMGCTNTINGIEWKEGNSAANGTIGENAFYGCSASNDLGWSIQIPSQVKTIYGGAFFGCGMKTFTWGASGVTASGTLGGGIPGVFENCPNLQTVTFTMSVSRIPSRAFCKCTTLETVTNAGVVTTIDSYAFYGCESFTDTGFAAIISGVTSPIGMYAFARCTSLINITIPGEVAELGEGCFSRSSYDFYEGRWDSEKEYPETAVPQFYTLSAFEEWMTEQYGDKRMDVWEKYDAIATNPSGNTSAVTIGWAAPSSGNPTRVLGRGCFMNNAGLTIDWDGFDSVEKIPEYCFFNCRSMFAGKNLSELPSGINYFGRFALAKTGLVGIGRRRDNGDFADPISASFAPALFMGCTGLTSLGDAANDNGDGLRRLFSTIPSAIPDACFYGCSELYDLDEIGTRLPAVVNVGAYAFAYCKLRFGDGNYNITNALYNIRQIGDGSFMGNPGTPSEFYGLPNVKYYPYLSFYGCTGLTKIVQLYSAYDGGDESTVEGESWGIPDVAVAVEGDSFGGNDGINSVTLPYSSYVVSVVSAGKDIDDPFSGVPVKQRVSLTVPNAIAANYLIDPYWKDFNISTSLEGLPLAIAISMDVPNDDVTLSGYGKIKVDMTLEHGLAIEWGDGDAWIPSPGEIPVDGNFDLSSISHPYSKVDNDSLTHPVTLKIYGDVISFEGAADNATSSVLDNKTVVPFFYTKVNAWVRQGGVDTTTPRLAENTWFRSVMFYTEKLTTIGDGAFGYCTQMLPPMIPSTVNTIGKNAFFGCDQIRSLDFIPPVPAGQNHNINTLGQYCFAYCDNLQDYTGFKNLTGLTMVPAGCFAKTKSVPSGNITKLDWLPDSVTSIGFAAFQHMCFSYFDLQTTNPITIGNYAFRYNTSLVNFTDGDGNPGIKMKLSGTNAFRDCTALTSLTGLLLANTTKLPVGAFKDCTSLADISGLGNNGVTEIGDGAFSNIAITDLTSLPSGIVSIGSTPSLPWDQFDQSIGGAFSNCRALTSLTGIANGETAGESDITHIGTAAFKDCTALGNLRELGTTHITELPQKCFSGCSVLTSVAYINGTDTEGLPYTVKSIGAYCFEGCTSITYIKLTRYDQSANPKVTELGDSISEGQVVNAVFPYQTLIVKNVEVYVPSAAETLYEGVWAVTVSGNNPRFTTEQIKPYTN